MPITHTTTRRSRCPRPSRRIRRRAIARSRRAKTAASSTSRRGSLTIFPIRASRRGRMSATTQLPTRRHSPACVNFSKPCSNSADRKTDLGSQRVAQSCSKEASMDKHSFGRRNFLKKRPALGAAGVPLVSGSRAATAEYDPAAKFEVKVREVEFRRNAAGRTLRARIKQPKGAGPFRTLLDLHGGAWNNKDRRAEEPMDRAIAASGVLVVAIDMTLAPEAPYPACVQDANYGVRWLKSKAAGWNGDPSRIGVYGSSSVGHVAELLVMRPRDARYNAIPLPGNPDVDATVAYVAM